MGKKFYQNDIPEIISQLKKIADKLEPVKNETDSSLTSAMKNFIEAYPNDTDLGKEIRKIWS